MRRTQPPPLRNVIHTAERMLSQVVQTVLRRTQQLEDVHQLTWRRGCTAFLCIAIAQAPGGGGGSGCLMLGFQGNDIANHMHGCALLHAILYGGLAVCRGSACGRALSVEVRCIGLGQQVCRSQHLM